MDENKEIHKYYNDLAESYDIDRFANSYGEFIHSQEIYLLSQIIKGNSNRILDLGCGTGRLTGFATDGLDFSENMLSIAQSKHDKKQFHLGSIDSLPFEENTFDYIYCFHVFMHLPLKQIEKTLNEVFRVLKPNGVFLFDIPSEARRKLLGKEKKGWHGATSLAINDIKKITKSKWSFLGYSGIMLFPIHAIPVYLRKSLRALDSFMNKTFLKKWASYHLVQLRKKRLYE